MSLAWSPDGGRLVVLDDKFIVILDILSGEVRKLRVSGRSVSSGTIKWSPSGEYIGVALSLVAGRYDRVKIIDPFRMDVVKEIKLDRDLYYRDISWSPDGGRLAVSFKREKRVYIDVSKLDLQSLLDREEYGKESYENDNVSDGVGLLIYSLNNRRVKKYKLIGGVDFGVMDWSPDGRYIVGGFGGDYIQVYDIQNVAFVSKPNKGIFELKKIEWLRNSNYIVGATFGYPKYDGMVFYWDKERFKRVKALKGLGDIDVLDWSPDGSVIATVPHTLFLVDGKEYNKIHVWDAVKGKRVTVIKIESNKINEVEWSSNELYLAVSYIDSKEFKSCLKIFDTKSFEEVLTFFSCRS